MAGALLLGGGFFSAVAAETWVDTKGRIDEVVADTTTVPLSSTLQPLSTRIPFTNFRYPYVDAELNVTFIADDPLIGQTKGDHLGIYRSSAADGRLLALVSGRETIVPGTTDARFISILGLHMGDNLSDFVFNAASTDNRQGIYLWRKGTLETIARTGETNVETGVLTGVDYASYSGTKIVYTATTAAGPLLALYDVVARTHTVLVHAGQAIPDGDGATFRYFSPQNWNNLGEIAFRAARVDDPHGTNTPNRGIYAWVKDAAGKLPAPTLASLRRVVDWNTPVPGLPGEAFTSIHSAPIRNGLITFVARGKSFSGIYWMPANESTPRVIADTTTGLSGLFENTFTQFAIYPTIIDREIIFQAGAGRFVGVFLYRPDSDALFLLADNRQPVEGKQVLTFEIASECLIGERLALKAMFTDRSQGVYLATIPGQALSRPAAPKR